MEAKRRPIDFGVILKGRKGSFSAVPASNKKTTLISEGGWLKV